MSKKIIVRSKNGIMKIETVGFVGTSCEDVDEFLRSTLGDEISRELKPVYFEREEENGYCYEPLCG